MKITVNSKPAQFTLITMDPEKDPIAQLGRGLTNSIFLAGPCPREDYTNDWRNDAYKILKSLGFKGNVISPTNSRFQELRDMYGDSALRHQTLWEYEAMKKASAIVFWVDRHIDQGFPAFTTNVEFGDWYDKEGVYVGFPVGADKNEYLMTRMDMAKKKYFTDLRDMLAAVVAHLDRKGDSFFTADTHFSQQRTLELSRRPFVDIHDMDLEMISNWNKAVTMNDTVYHAGDFGDVQTMRDILSSLNFKKLKWVLGNYDRDSREQIEEIVQSLPRDIELLDTASFYDDESQKTYYVVHEPDEGCAEPVYPADVVLFGHIHGRAFAKKNGFDLAVDYHRYTPISMDQVRWFANAIQYWDHNVFCQRASIPQMEG